MSANGNAEASRFWSLDRLAQALAAESDVTLPLGSAALAGISTDTRALAPNDVFVALKGENYDGHDFIPQALERGARALVVSRPERGARAGIPVYAVRDTLTALGALAKYRRNAWGGIVAAIAGSNGKTTTKDLVASALGSRLEVHATAGNLNNRVGLPLTLLAVPERAQVAVVEVGTNVPGEVEKLRDIAEPDIAIVTCIAEEHLEGLGDISGVLREETSVYQGVELAIAPAAQPEIADVARRAARRVITAGLADADVVPAEWRMERDGTGVLRIDGVEVRPPVRGRHNLQNAMLALAAALECGVPLESAAGGIAAMPQPSMRLAWEDLGRATLVNDAYNANPGSMAAAIELLSEAGDGKQRVAILGGMRELGAHSDRLHRKVARLALQSGADIIAAVDDMAPALHDEGGEDPRVIVAPDVDELWPLVMPRLHDGAIILLKASRGVRLERLVPHITAWART